ncbi:MAG: sensor histidine kinase, partial [Christensenellales bacterium]
AYARLARKNTPTDTLVFSEGGVSYTAVLTQLSTTPLSAVAFMTTTGIVRGLPALHLILIFLSVFAMLLMLLTLHRTLQTMLQPTNEIVAAMRNLGKGDFSIRFQNKKTYAEYQIIGNAFNDMVSEIQQLKIQAYEEKLHKEKAELRFLQLQLTPHFFINNLNVIYSLAQVQDYAAIGDMVMALTDYFRYAMRPISQMVLLADEIQHVNNYLAIQRMRYKNRFAVEIDCPPEHAACSVPLFVMQTFVGNSLKYAFLGDNRVLIHIAVSADARLETLQIAIDDNGPGFPEAILSGNWEQLASSGHIGLDNLQSRLKLLFADRAGLSLSNRPEGGAHVGITMPYIIGGSYVPSSLG